MIISELRFGHVVYTNIISILITENDIYFVLHYCVTLLEHPSFIYFVGLCLNNTFF